MPSGGPGHRHPALLPSGDGPPGDGGGKRVSNWPHNYAGIRPPAYPAIPLGHRHHEGGGSGPAAGAPCGVQLRRRSIRHTRIPHVVAVLDRRVHRFDGRVALRVVGHHPVPLHQPGRTLFCTVGAGRDNCEGLRPTRCCARCASTCNSSESSTSWPRVRRWRKRPTPTPT